LAAAAASETSGFSPDLATVLRMLQALAASKDANDFCRAMALEVLEGVGVVSTFVGRLDSDGHITMIGSYGYSKQRVENTPRPSIWDDLAIAETVRTGEVLVFETWDAYIGRYPDKGHLASPGQAFVCMPLKVRGARAGGFGITFTAPLSGAQLNPQLWQVFAAVGDVFLTHGWEAEMARWPVPTIDFGQDEKFAASSLSDRERAVLTLMAAGKTNSSIARELAYSESTIKQDTIRIFKLLGVKTRADAVLAARVLGLVKSAEG